MVFIVRGIRFSRHEPFWLLVAVPALIAFLIYRYPAPLSVAILIALCSTCFCLPFFIRTIVVLNYPKYRRPIRSIGYLAVAAMVVMHFFGHYQAIQYATASYFSLAVGTVFWAASDPMFEMVNWLAFPTEYGRAPDEIQHFDTSWIPWPDSDRMIRAHLFRFRYDQEWDYGITSGPLTFAFGNGNFEGKSPDEIYAAYWKWYDQPGIRDLRPDED
jgi:hypothetical protein